MTKVAVLIDGGHLRVLTHQANLKYSPDLIEKVAQSCVLESETMLRTLYYDCAPYQGKQRLPVSGIEKEFTGDDSWLRNLEARDMFAVRRGVLKFRGFKPKRVPIANAALADEDFKPDFEQKGVDMRIGLDIANFSATKSVERIILLSGDTDCVPAMKHARINGLQIVMVTMPASRLAKELKWHSDFHRPVAWPAP